MEADITEFLITEQKEIYHMIRRGIFCDSNEFEE